MCGVWCVVCGVRCAVCSMWWCVVCSVWFVCLFVPSFVCMFVCFLSLCLFLYVVVSLCAFMWTLMALQCESCANGLTPPTCACGFDPTGSYLTECGSGGLCQSDGSCECTDAALNGRHCDVCNASSVSECRRDTQVLHDNNPVVFAQVSVS